MKTTRGRILVIRGGAIGDFILTLPAITALRQQFPDAHLEVLGYPHIAQLAVAGGLVSRLQPIEARALAGFFADGGALPEALGDYFSEFDIIVSYLYDPDGIFRANVARVSSAQFIVGPHRPDELAREHATRVFLWPLERLAIFGADPVPRLRLAGGAVPTLAEASSPLAVHPGSGSERKNWPEAKWSELLQRVLAALPHRVLLVGGEAEGHRLERLVRGLPAGRCELAQHLPLAELAGRLRGCRAFIGHDSGITHLAAALGLPVLALWGETSVEIWRPQGARVRILREPTGLRLLAVDRVCQELVALLAESAPAPSEAPQTPSQDV